MIASLRPALRRARRSWQVLAFAAPRLGKLDAATLQAMWWAGHEVRRLRQAVRVDGLETTAAPPPGLPAFALRGVRAGTWLTRANCLERSLVLQRWFASHGARYDVLVGVDPTGEEFRAHAWLEEVDGPQEGYTVLTRRPAP